MDFIIRIHLKFGVMNFLKNGKRSLSKDLIINLKECGTFIYLIVKQGLNQKI